MLIIAYLGGNVKEYNEKSQELLAALKIRCPAHPRLPMSNHAKYSRKIKETGEEVTIFRLICHACGGTAAVLPDFLLPHKHYSANEIESVLLQRESGSSVYEIDTAASISAVRQWLSEIPVRAREWVSKLKSLALERFACPVSEASLSGLPPLEQIRELSRRLPRIKSTNLLGYGGIYAQGLPAPNST